MKYRFQQIYIEITNVCNMHCPFCEPTLRTSSYMDLDAFKTIIKRIEPFSHSIYLHVKGEPLIHPYFESLLEVLKDTSLSVKITTNGSKLAKFSDLLINHPNIKRINVSLQSWMYLSSEERTKYFDDLKSFIKLNHQKHLYLRNWALDEVTNNDLIKMLKTLYPNALFKDEELLSPFVHYSKQERFSWPSLANNEQIPSYCLGGNNQLGVLVDGSVCLCCLDNDGNTIVGNLLNEDLDTILQKEIFKKAVKEMPYFELCKKCTYRLIFKKEGS